MLILNNETVFIVKSKWGLLKYRFYIKFCCNIELVVIIFLSRLEIKYSTHFNLENVVGAKL